MNHFAVATKTIDRELELLILKPMEVPPQPSPAQPSPAQPTGYGGWGQAQPLFLGRIGGKQATMPATFTDLRNSCFLAVEYTATAHSQTGWETT